MSMYKVLAVHGRFQPPLHVNHWNYIKHAFDNADKVRIYITNPYIDESFETSASWRNDPSSNPFRYEQRKRMFEKFFSQKGIVKERFTIEPFNITEDKSFDVLDPAIPMVVNVYSEWSAKKVGLFESHDIPVVKLRQTKQQGASGTKIREIIKQFSGSPKLKDELVQAGFLPEAIPGLLEELV